MPDDQPPMTEDEIRKALKFATKSAIFGGMHAVIPRALRNLLACHEALGDCLTALHRLSKISIGIAQTKARAALGESDDVARPHLAPQPDHFPDVTKKVEPQQEGEG